MKALRYEKMWEDMGVYGDYKVSALRISCQVFLEIDKKKPVE